MNKVQRLIVLVLIFSIALACNLPGGAPTETPVPGEGSPSPTATETSTPTALPISATACLPKVITNVDANVRSGPGQVYGVLGQLPQGSSANVSGKNSDGSWWYIEFPAGPNGRAWIAGSVTTATCIPDTLAIIAAPPTPVLPSNTPTFTATNTPTITSTSGIIIVLPPLIFSTPTLNFVFPTFDLPDFPNP